MNINNLKQAGKITVAVIASVYIVFLLIPLILSPILNSYSDKIEALAEEATGYKVKLEKLSVVTTPKLTAGIKIKSAELMIPTGEEFFEAENCKISLSLLPVLIGRIEADSVSIDSLSANLQVRQDGRFLIEEFLPQPDPDKSVETVKPLPLGFKLSNRLPNITIKDYIVTFIDMQSKSEYTLSGQNLRLSDFILDKKIKFSTKGKLTLNSNERLNFDIKLFNKLMPEIALNDLVFSPKPQETKTEQDFVFNIIELFKSLDKTELTANFEMNLNTSGTFKNPVMKGYIFADKISMLVDNEKLPDSYIKFSSKGRKSSLNLNLFTAPNEHTLITGNFKNGRNPNIDVQFKSNMQFNNLFKILNNLAEAFNFNELKTLSATGGINADFIINTNMKKIKSSGYFKISPSSISYGLFNIAIKNIKADVDLNNMLNIKDAGFEILGHPLKVYGVINNNSNTDLHVTADNLLIKGLIAAAGQVQLLNENDFKSGTLNLEASLSGKLAKLTPALNLSIDNLDIKNLPYNTRVKLPNAKLIFNTDDKEFNGILLSENLKITNSDTVLSVPEVKIDIGRKDIDIEKAYILLNNSRIDITGKIANYVSDKMKIAVNANGNLLANDLKTLLPKDVRGLVAAAGKLPLDIAISGNKKVQDLKFNITSSPQNFISLIDIAALKDKNTIIHSDVRFFDDSVKFTDTGIFINNLNNSILSIEGSINNLSKDQKLNLRLSVPKRIAMSVPGFKNSSLITRGDVDITGTISNPYLNGLFSMPVLSIPDIALSINNLVANINGPLLKGNATIQNLKSGGLAAENIASEFELKNYNIFYIKNLVGDAFGGKIAGNISYAFNNGRFTVNMTGSDMSALKTIEGAAGIKNAMSGTLSFAADVVSKGATDVEIIKNLAGNLTFEIINGKFMNVGRFDNLLYAKNIIGNAVLKSAVTSVANLPLIQNTAEFKNINGKLNFNRGWAVIDSITTSGPLMAYYVTGQYNILNSTTELVILGRLDEKVVSLLGPLGELSVDKLTSYLPKFGDLTAVLIDSMTSNPENENIAALPALSTGTENYKDFKVEFNGGIESASSVKSFKWLSDCDTSALDIKSEINNTAEAIKNSVDDTKQQILNVKENLKNLFKL